MLLVIILVLLGYIIWSSRTEAQKRPLVERAEQVSGSVLSVGKRVAGPFNRRGKKRREQLTSWLNTHYFEQKEADAEVKAMGEWFKGLSEGETNDFLEQVMAIMESLGIKLDAIIKGSATAPDEALRLGLFAAWKSRSAKASA